MTKKTEDLIFAGLKEIVPKLEYYRAKNVTKYNAEASGEHGGEYSVKERYKNRTRIIDIFLPTLKSVIEKYYSQSTPTNNSLD